MAINGVLRIGLVQIRVLDLDKTLDHYTKRLGLIEVGRTADGRVMLKGYDEFDHHSVTLRKAESAGLDFVAFKADSEATVNRVVADTKAKYPGWKITDVAAQSDQPGFGKRVCFAASTGHMIHLYSEVEMAKVTPQIVNPHIWEEEPKGMAAKSLDHCLLYGTNAGETIQWFREVVGFAMAECVYKPDGSILVAWLTGSNKAHDVAILDYDKPGKLHHVGFNLEDWSAIGHAADIIGRYGISLDIGPTRHGITRGQTIYFFDPSGNRCETFAGGYAYMPDQPLRHWDADHVGEGIFYYDKVLNERFLSVVS